MMRLGACVWFHYSTQRILRWIGAIGLLMLLGSLFAPDRAAAPLLALGSIFLVGFPVLVGGIAYRQLIGNRRIALVPDIRIFATGALLVLAVCGAALAALVAANDGSQPDPLQVGVLAFAAISLYLILSQWLITRRMGAMLVPVALIVLTRLSISEDALVWQQLLAPWHWFAIACLAWLWLAIAVSEKGMPRALAGLDRAGSERGDTSSVPGPEVWFMGRPQVSTAPGTLMRGLRDGWRNSVAAALAFVLLMPVVLSIVFTLLGIPFRNPAAREFGAELFLAMSALGICIFPGVICAEWPVRMRLNWLRLAGDREAFWRLVERAMLGDLLMIAVVATFVAGGFLLWSDVARELVLLYLAGSIVVGLTSGYLGCWVRSSGWSAQVQGLLLFVILFAIVIAGMRLASSSDPGRVFWLLPILGLLVLLFRSLARARFRRMDWCAVRPKRFPRRPA